MRISDWSSDVCSSDLRARFFRAGAESRAPRSRCARRYRSLIHPFEQIFEIVEPRFPEAVHAPGPVDQRRERALLPAGMRLAAFVPVAHPPRLLEDAAVFGTLSLRTAGTRGQRADSRPPIEAPHGTAAVRTRGGHQG